MILALDVRATKQYTHNHYLHPLCACHDNTKFWFNDIRNGEYEVQRKVAEWLNLMEHTTLIKMCKLREEPKRQTDREEHSHPHNG